ncbi:ABC transporter ATP-binding protein [Cellulomonas sp. ES6]|uniref:ABC transporter ATP-binding protein n=1 Tax=Cellulomonas sp. ES6 TaxID=3039384 RepID=UPI0024B6B2C5|nr:ABC transporter ATP-binding protein [Cellulomonas sp. ES6]WHP17997.1 ABC transporter ATP-binding protein [Cellulomonas sp. ES6]
MTAPALHAAGLAKTYDASPPVPVLTGVDLAVHHGERVAITGRSGAGKSTLLNLLGLLDEPTAGRLSLLGRETTSLSRRERDTFRAVHLGFVFQDHHVLGRRSCAANVALKLAVLGTDRSGRRQQVAAALERVGLSARAHAEGRLLSGGEKQRLALARAFVSRPAVILADEPTGNLDPDNASSVLDLFDSQAQDGVAVVVITHDDRVARWADRALRLRDGELLPSDDTDPGDRR